jgi:hypothetical protein
LSGKAEDEGGLTPSKDDTAAWQKTGRKERLIFVAASYKVPTGRGVVRRTNGAIRSAQTASRCRMGDLCGMYHL